MISEPVVCCVDVHSFTVLSQLHNRQQAVIAQAHAVFQENVKQIYLVTGNIIWKLVISPVKRNISNKIEILREDFNKKNCIFYDIVIKGRGVKDQNLISRNI